MGIENTSAVQEAYQAYKETTVAKTDDKNKKVTSKYGKSIGDVKLSEAGAKYYEQLKKKFSNMEFILVSKDKRAEVEANAARYARPDKTVVLIDDEKIEQMAADPQYAKKIEGVISNAASSLEQMQKKMGNDPNVKGYGMQINDDGTASYFAVLKKSSAAQKQRIEKQAQKKAEQKKADKKEAAKKAEEKRIEDRKQEKSEKVKDDEKEWNSENTVKITANSVDELMQKITDFYQQERTNQVMTDDEKKVGQNFDLSL